MKGWQKLIGDIAAWLMVIGGVVYGLYGYTPGDTVTTTTTTTPQVKQEKTAEISAEDIQKAIASATGSETNTTADANNNAAKVVTITPGKVSSSSTSQATKSAVTTIAPVQENKQDTVTISIKTPDGYLVAPKKVAIGENTMAGDVLSQVCQEAGLKLNTSGSGATLYTKGIGGWNEFDKGPKSGWTYKINGVTGDRSSGVKQVKAGDKIEWIYVLDYSEGK